MRLLRLARLLKLVGKIRGLRAIVGGLERGVASAVYIVLLLLLVFYLFALLCMVFFRRNDPVRFEVYSFPPLLPTHSPN